MADILIRGMKMPKTCQICRTAKFDRIVGCEEWDRLSIAQRMYMRSETCPLVPLPEGHGRIVDAAEILEKANNSPWFDGDVAELGLLLGSEVTTIVPSEGGKNE